MDSMALCSMTERICKVEKHDPRAQDAHCAAASDGDDGVFEHSTCRLVVL